MNRQSLIKAVYALNCNGIATPDVAKLLTDTCLQCDFCSDTDHTIYIYDFCEVYVDRFGDVNFS
jgi:hypothetical protein